MKSTISPGFTARQGGQKQRGAVLVVGLIMLAAMTLLVISMIRTSILELRIGGANQVALETLANAEVALIGTLATNAGRWAPRFTLLAPGHLAAPVFTTPTLINGTAVVTIDQTSCGSTPAGSSVLNINSSNAVQVMSFNVSATAQSVLGGTQRVGQGVEVTIAPGSCV